MILEKYEWCDFWWEEADKQDERRVLLIGDSIVRGYKPFVNELLKGTAHVDMLATSKAVDNPDIFKEIGYILDQKRHRYDAVVFNNGLHGAYIPTEEYESHMDSIIRTITDWAAGASLLLALSTPVTVVGNPETIHDEITASVISRNAAMCRLAQKHGLQTIDLYDCVYGKSQYRMNDGCHYNELGCKALADMIAKAIFVELENRANK